MGEPGRASGRATILVLAVVCVLGFGARAFVSWDRPLLERHGFRQTQTALTTYWFAREGIEPLRPPLPLFGLEGQSIPFEFPAYQALVAEIVGRVPPEADATREIDRWSRFVSLAFYLVAGALGGALLWRETDGRAAAAFAALWLALPYPFFWSATCSIEFMALAFALAYLLLLTVRPVGTARTVAWLVGVILVGVGAYLVKSTTALSWGPLCALAAWRAWRPLDPAGRAGRIALVLVAIAIPFLGGVAWVLWSDAVKSENAIAAAHLTSRALRAWTFGTLAQRLDPRTWLHIGSRAATLLLSWPLALSSLLAFRSRTTARVAFAMAVPIMTSLLVFTNLNLIHDYYQIAILPAVLGTCGLGCLEVVDRVAKGRSRLAASVCAVLIAGGALFGWWHHCHLGTRYTHVFVDNRDETFLRLAAEIRRRSGPDDLVMLEGLDWSSEVPYYAGRKMLVRMTSASGEEMRAAVARSPKRLAVTCLEPSELFPASEWTEVSRVGDFRLLQPIRRAE